MWKISVLIRLEHIGPMPWLRPTGAGRTSMQSPCSTNSVLRKPSSVFSCWYQTSMSEQCQQVLRKADVDKRMLVGSRTAATSMTYAATGAFGPCSAANVWKSKRYAELFSSTSRLWPPRAGVNGPISHSYASTEENILNFLNEYGF